MKKKQKTNEQLHQDVKDSFNLFIKNLKELLKHGTYQLNYVDRDYDTEVVDGATIEVNGHTLVLRRNKVDILLKMRNLDVKDLLNQALLDEYDKMTIEQEIEYHAKHLKSLMEHKDKIVKRLSKDADIDAS